MDQQDVIRIYAQPFECDGCGRKVEPKDRIEVCVDDTPVLWFGPCCGKKRQEEED